MGGYLYTGNKARSGRDRCRSHRIRKGQKRWSHRIRTGQVETDAGHIELERVRPQKGKEMAAQETRAEKGLMISVEA